MYKGMLAAIEPSFSWLNLLESSIGSLVGALVGGLIALWIAKSQIKKGEEQFEKQMYHNEVQFNKQMEHNNELRIKSDSVNLEIAKITKEYEYNLEIIDGDKTKILLMIEALQDYQEKIYSSILNNFVYINESKSLQSVLSSANNSAILFSAFGTTLQYTFSFGYKNTKILTNEERVELADKITELHDLINNLEKPNDGNIDEVISDFVSANFQVVKKTREILLIYIRSIEKLDIKLNELNEKFKIDIDEQNQKLSEVYANSSN